MQFSERNLIITKIITRLRICLTLLRHCHVTGSRSFRVLYVLFLFRICKIAPVIHRHNSNCRQLCVISLHWRHNEHDGVSNHRCFYCLLNRLFWRSSNNTSKLRVTGLCDGNQPVTGGFSSQRPSNTENVSVWWRHHVRAIELLLFKLWYFKCIRTPKGPKHVNGINVFTFQTFNSY